MLIARVPRISIFPDQLIRPTFQLVTVPTGPGHGTHTEFGDIQLFDLGREMQTTELRSRRPAQGSLAAPNR